MAVDSARRTADDGVLAGYRGFIEETLAEWQVPGAAVAVVTADDVLFLDAFGHSDVDAGQLVTPETLFPIASVTKSFTAAAMALLVDRGRVDWDTPVRSYASSFALYDEFVSARVTPRDLLSHVTGVPRHDALWSNRDSSREELMRCLAYLEPNADLRQVYQYSNLLYMAAGYLVGIVEASSWEEFVRAELFEPLGMKATNFSIAESKFLPNCSRAYAIEDGRPCQVDYYERQQAIGPCGAIVSSATEMSRWVRLHLGRGRIDSRRVISEPQVRELHSVQVLFQKDGRYPEMSNADSGYGLGWTIEDYRGHKLINHGGGITGFSSYATFMPSVGVGMIILTNLDAAYPATRSISWNLYDRYLRVAPAPWRTRYIEERAEAEAAASLIADIEEEDRIAGTSPSHALQEYAGTYRHPGYGDLNVAHESYGLSVAHNDRRFPLTHYHYDVFRSDSLPGRFALFQSNLRGDIAGVDLSMEPTSVPVRFSRVHKEAGSLRDLVGEYRLPSGRVITVWVNGSGNLSANMPVSDMSGRDFPLTALGDRVYAIEAMDPASYAITFDEPCDGTVLGATVRADGGAYRAVRATTGSERPTDAPQQDAL
jgi:CubicO group peptidase (beta-lactamase class C family)